MKKLFTFIALAFSAMSMQAQQTISFAGLQTSDVTLDDQTVWEWGTASGKDALSYTGDNTVSRTVTIKGIKFETKRNAANNFYRLYDDGLYANGTNVNIIVSGLKKNQEVTFVIEGQHATTETTISAVSGCTADAGNPESTISGDGGQSFKFVATGSEMQIKNGGSRFLLKTIEIGSEPAGDGPIEEVTETTTWTISDVEAGVALCTENVVNWQDKGLFLRSNNASGSHSVKSSAETGSGTFTNGTAWTADMSFNCPGAGISANGVTDKKANSAAASGNDRCVAFNAAADGALFVAIKSASYDESKADRLLYIWSSDGEMVASKKLSETVVPGKDEMEQDIFVCQWVELSCDVKSGKSYFIGGSNANHIGTILFVKGGTTSVEAVKASVPQNDGKVYNIQGQYVGTSLDNQPAGLYIVNGKKIQK